MSNLADFFDAWLYRYEPSPGRGEYHNMRIDAGPLTVERIVPPAGEEYAFDRSSRPRRVEISVSPTGRSVRVFVDGEEIK